MSTKIKNKKPKQIPEPYLSLLITSAFGLALLLFRLMWVWNSIYFFLAWNLVLAWVPLLFAQWLVNIQKANRTLVTQWILFFLWLLFFPNAPYILTDYFHLYQLRDVTPLWFDLVLITSFAWLGLQLGFLSLARVQAAVTKHYSARVGYAVVVVTTVLASFGIFVGRYLRWNSWDVVTNPWVLVTDFWNLVQSPFLWQNALGLTVFFAIFLLLAYQTTSFLPLNTELAKRPKK